MQAGFMMLEAGFARTREVINILQECIVDTCLCALLFWAFGFAFMFGVGNGIIGHEFFFLNGAPATYTFHGTLDTGIAFMAFWLFQFAFADTCSTITSGAMVGRTAFKGDLLYSIGVSGFIYPILGHWAWGPGGFLQTAHDGVWFRDFAGSTVVHTMGGMIALAGAIVLGPRLGRKFKRDGGGMPPGHDLNIAALGGVILWFGWYGFNPGSTLSAIDSLGIGRVATNTTLAAAAGGLSAMVYVYPRLKKWDIGITVNGFLGGLVGITAPCYWVNTTGAVIIGARRRRHRRARRRPRRAPPHRRPDRRRRRPRRAAASGARGRSACSPPASTATGSRACSGAAALKQLWAQIWGNARHRRRRLRRMGAVFLAINAAGLLRVSDEGEHEGIDIHEHGSPAYHPEPAYMGQGLS